jgi:hypothetical protein
MEVMDAAGESIIILRLPIRRRDMRSDSLVAAAFLVFASGCASGGLHPVSFAGETSTAGSAPPDGKTVHVVRNVSMKDTLLEARIRYRLQEFLLERGYTLASADTADLYVLATFGAGERMVDGTATVFREAEDKIDRNREGAPVRRTYSPARVEYLRVPLLKNSVWLQVLSSDAKYFRATGLVKNLWRGESAMLARSDHLTDYARFLLVPSLRYFGRSTQDIVTVDVRDNDAAWH